MSRLFKYSFATICVSVVFSMVTLSNDSARDPAITIASVDAAPVYSENGTGAFNKILHKLIEGYGGPVNIVFYPTERLRRDNDLTKARCLYIITENVSANRSRRVEREFIGPINKIALVVYTRKDLPEVQTIEDLSQLSIATDAHVAKAINRMGIKETFAIHGQSRLIDMLMKGRVSALIGFDYGLDMVIKSSNNGTSVKKNNLRLTEMNTGLRCNQNEHTKPFSKHVKMKLQSIKDSGWLSETLKSN